MGFVMDELLSFSFSAAVQKDLQIRKVFDDIFINLMKFKETGDIAYLEKERHRQAAAKGNVETTEIGSSSKKNRQKEAAPLADITENVIQSNNKVKVKKEKISLVAQSDSVSTISDSSVKDAAIEIKKESEDMPAPRKLPPRKKKVKTEAAEVPKRSTRTRTKPRKYDAFDVETDKGKQSDVMIQNTTITTIDITEDKSSDTENNMTKAANQNLGSEVPKEKPMLECIRSTRSKMRQVNKQATVEEATDAQGSESAEHELKKIRSTRTKTVKKNKRSRSESSDQEKVEEQKQTKKSKSNTSEAEVNKTSQTEYDDAISTLETNEPGTQIADATYVATESQPILNQTVVLESNTADKCDKNKQMEETKKPKDPRTPPKPKSKKKTKEIFSPFEKTPVKKKVEAFEKLQSEASSIPIKTKTRMQTEDGNADNRVSGKPKAFTPFASKFLPKTCSTSKINKIHPGKIDMSTNGGDSMLSFKSLSALKASQVEFQEREKRRQEKDREALKKREALLHAQTEEKRRRREEKQLKAQQQREILEKEKQKLLEEHKRKEEKYKKAFAEREEKLLQQQEEIDKKRLLAKKKELIKEKEDRMKEKEERTDEHNEGNELARQIKKQKMQRAQLEALPIYMTTRAPLLPTEDCYDSDDSEYSTTNRGIPVWGTGRSLQKKLVIMEIAGQKMKNTLFCRHTYTPDLQEIFVSIDPKKLKRTSSAIWRKPPRYTLFTGSNNIHFSEDSEDEIDI